MFYIYVNINTLLDIVNSLLQPSLFLLKLRTINQEVFPTSVSERNSVLSVLYFKDKFTVSKMYIV